MINQLEDLFIKMWRASSILSVFFAVYFAYVFTRNVEEGEVRGAVLIGVFVASGIFAGVTAWAMKRLEQGRRANELAEKQLKMSGRINQLLQKRAELEQTRPKASGVIQASTSQ